MESNEKKKLRPMHKVTIAFVCAAAVLTFFSKTLYNLNVPVVEAADFASGSLWKTRHASGIVTPNETQEVFAPASLKVTRVHVARGDEVKTGDVLVELDVSGLEGDMLEMKTAHEKLLAVYAGTRRTEDKRLLDLDIADSMRRIERTENLIEQCREVLSPMDGTVDRVIVRAGMTADGAAGMVGIADNSKGFGVTYLAMSESMGWLRLGGKVDVVRRGSAQNAAGEVADVWVEPDGRVAVKVDISGEGMRSGEPVELKFLEISERYPCIVPVDAIVDGTYIFVVRRVSGVLGEELVAQKTRVTVLDRGDRYAAIEETFEKTDQVVVASSKPLANGRVKLYE